MLSFPSESARRSASPSAQRQGAISVGVGVAAGLSLVAGELPPRIAITMIAIIATSAAPPPNTKPRLRLFARALTAPNIEPGVLAATPGDAFAVLPRGKPLIVSGAACAGCTADTRRLPETPGPIMVRAIAPEIGEAEPSAIAPEIGDADPSATGGFVLEREIRRDGFGWQALCDRGFEHVTNRARRRHALARVLHHRPRDHLRDLRRDVRRKRWNRIVHVRRGVDDLLLCEREGDLERVLTCLRLRQADVAERHLRSSAPSAPCTVHITPVPGPNCFARFALRAHPSILAGARLEDSAPRHVMHSRTDVQLCIALRSKSITRTAPVGSVNTTIFG